MGLIYRFTWMIGDCIFCGVYSKSVGAPKQIPTKNHSSAIMFCTVQSAGSKQLVGSLSPPFFALQLNNHCESIGCFGSFEHHFLFKTKEARWCHPVLLEQFNLEIGWTNMRNMCIYYKYVACVSLNYGEWRAVNIVFWWFNLPLLMSWFKLMFDVAEVKYFDPTPKIPPPKKQKKKQDQQVDSQGWLFECLVFRIFHWIRQWLRLSMGAPDSQCTPTIYKWSYGGPSK